MKGSGVLLIVAGASLGLAGCVTESRRHVALPFYRSLAQSAATVDAAAAAEMIGSYRGNKGLAALTVDDDLQKAAATEAHAMATADKPFSADVVKARLAKEGFAHPAANLSAGYHTLAEAFSGWRDSPQHNSVMLDRNARRMGIATAYAPGSKYKVYWAMVVAQ